MKELGWRLAGKSLLGALSYTRYQHLYAVLSYGARSLRRFTTGYLILYISNPWRLDLYILSHLDLPVYLTSKPRRHLSARNLAHSQRSFSSQLLTLSCPLKLLRLLLLIGMEKFPVLLPTTSMSSVEGTMYGWTLLRVCVLCSYAYAYPMRLASLQAAPMKLSPNLCRCRQPPRPEAGASRSTHGILGPVSTKVPLMFSTTLSLAG